MQFINRKMDRYDKMGGDFDMHAGGFSELIGNEQIKEEPWAPFLQSTVVFGRCRMIEDQALATALVREIAGKYYPDAAAIEEEIAHAGKAVQIYEITIEHLSGKEIQ